MTVSDVAVRLHGDEPGFLRRIDGWDAVVPHLLVAQPASRRVIDVPRVSVAAVPRDASLTDLPALLDCTALPSSPVVDGAALVGRLEHERLRIWLAEHAEGEIAWELRQRRLATLAMLHDISNALIVLGSVLHGERGLGEHEAYLHVVEMLGLIRSLHGGAPIEYTSLEVSEVVARLLPMARALARGLAKVEVGRLDKGAARCAELLLERAITGLVTNSREAMEQRGTVIRVDVEADDAEVRVRVCDDGPGIPDYLVPRLFERGFSTKGSAARGTGLASLRDAARRVGGDLRFERGTAGATFVLVLRRA
jgi:signal transduction histidine kinase